METFTILIIEPTELSLEVLTKQLQKALKNNVIIDKINYLKLENFIKNKIPIYDLVFIGELIEIDDIIKIAKQLRLNDYYMPLILLTQIQETKLTLPQIESGIDDCLNVYEVESETFSWSLTSLIQKSEIKQKAEEFETIRAKILSINNILANISHEINNPLGIMRLALFQLKNKINNDESLLKYIQMLSDNVDKIANKVADLRKVREEIKMEEDILRKILKKKEF